MADVSSPKPADDQDEALKDGEACRDASDDFPHTPTLSPATDGTANGLSNRPYASGAAASPRSSRPTLAIASVCLAQPRVIVCPWCDSSPTLTAKEPCGHLRIGLRVSPW